MPDVKARNFSGKKNRIKKQEEKKFNFFYLTYPELTLTVRHISTQNKRAAYLKLCRSTVKLFLSNRLGAKK